MTPYDMGSLTPDQLSSLLNSPENHRLADYMAARRAIPADSTLHQLLGPLEHRADAREQVRASPIVDGLGETLVGIPGYTLSKFFGMSKGRSPASWDEMAQGYKGVQEGLGDAAVNGWQSLKGLFSR